MYLMDRNHGTFKNVSGKFSWIFMNFFSFKIDDAVIPSFSYQSKTNILSLLYCFSYACFPWAQLLNMYSRISLIVNIFLTVVKVTIYTWKSKITSVYCTWSAENLHKTFLMSINIFVFFKWESKKIAFRHTACTVYLLSFPTIWIMAV